MIAISLASAVAAGVAAAPVVTRVAPATPHYALGATVVPDRGSISVDVVISFPADVREVEMILGDTYTVEATDAGAGGTVSVAPTEKPWGGLQSISARFDPSGQAPRLRIRYSGMLKGTGEPPLNAISAALTELNLDSMWLPLRSDLGAPFTVDARIAGLPADAVVVSQGSAERSRGEVRLRRPFPDVDFAFVASPGLQQRNAGGFEIFARDPENERARLFQTHGGRSIAFLEKWFGPMPNKPARLVVVTRPRTSGYARKGYIVFTEGNKGSEDGVAKFTAHEFAHAWFSNANATTEHRWLDESIAEYASIRYVEEVFGKAAADAMFEGKQKAAGDAKPVLTSPPDGDAIYAKGPLLLRELEWRIGRGSLDPVLADVAKRRIGETAEFLQILAERSNPATAAWFEAQLKE